MVDLWPDLVEILLISVVFAEIYTRWKLRRLLARVVGAAKAIGAGEDTPDARLVKTLGNASLRVLGAFLLERDDDGKWHLTKTARRYGAIALSAAGELVQARGAGQPPAVGTLLGAGGLDLDQLVGLGLGALPKKQQGLAAIAYALAKPFLGGLGARTSTKKKGVSASGEKVSETIPGPGKM